MPTPDEGDLVTAAILALAEKTLTDAEVQILEKELTAVSKILEHIKQAGIQEGLQEGIQEGLKRGIREGRAEGRLEEKRTIARAMLADGDSIAKIVRVTGLTPPEVEALKPH